ncbi:MAG: formate/nitrite transporter family protein [Acidobacteriaceae bacterium]|nr:formate/nitrite transporter family protein [Acidobacteriaceae bacterium]MBV9296988.1 formate/nitrite transporter family protein [Acidobacteriaceae bacterium]MBV9765606.1 formate/nitrite transporter family protein [Acidobacteriaceae bacterium]
MIIGEGREDPGVVAPELTEKQREEAQERTSVSVDVVHEAIRHDGEEELNRPVSALAWSGLAAGMSMGFSFVSQALLRSHLPDSTWRPLIVNIGYPVGFLIAIIGRQQLFTENTLTAIIPLLAKRNVATIARVLRLWAVVLAANLVGAHLFAWVVADTPMFRAEVQASMLSIAKEAAAVSFGTAILRGIFAGWLIAMVVWMLAAIDTGRIAVIVIITYVVGIAGLTHIIAGSVDVLFLAMVGAKSWFAVAWGYMLPTLIGNTIGGVSLTAAVNHAQVVAGMQSKRKSRVLSE